MTELSYYEWRQSISGRGYQAGYHNLLWESGVRDGGICDSDSQRSLIVRPNQSSESESGSA